MTDLIETISPWMVGLGFLYLLVHVYFSEGEVGYPDNIPESNKSPR